MASPTETIVINATRQTAEEIRDAINAQGSQSHLTERKNLDGDTAAWIVVANLAAQSLPHILTFIKDRLAAKQVKKITIGEWEVENPTPEMIDQLLSNVTARPTKGDDG